jgi:hypothetical protein
MHTSNNNKNVESLLKDKKQKKSPQILKLKKYNRKARGDYYLVVDNNLMVVY